MAHTSSSSSRGERSSRRPRTSPSPRRRISMRARGRSTSRTRASTARESLSFRMYAAALAPSSRTRCSRSSFQERSITGVSRSPTSRRSARHSAKPSSPGIKMSLTTSSGWTRNAMSSAVAPSSASWTSHPAVRRRSEMNQVTPGSSSATTTRRPLSRTSAAAPRPRPAIRSAPGRSWCSHGARAIAPSGVSPPKRIAPFVRCETISCTRAIAPQSAPSTSVPSPRGTRVKRAVGSTPSMRADLSS